MRWRGSSPVIDFHTHVILAHKVGPDRIVLGGDYPVGEDDPAAFFEGAKLSAEAKRMILGENAAKLLGISI